MKITRVHKYLLLVLLLNVSFAIPAYAEIYKSVGPDGRITYSNVKSKGATKLELDPDTNSISNDRPRGNSETKKRVATPSNFPKVDKDTQNQRDVKRKEILQSELEAEKTALEQAKKAYAEGESNPEVYQRKNATGTTSTFRNVAKFDEKMKALKADVDSHERNIELLQKELSAL